MAQPNALFQETVRAYLRTWYPRVVTGMPEIREGSAVLSDAPGLQLVTGLREDDAPRRLIS
ncbi:hypothetical protein [Streptomyces tubercidicus]